MLTHNRLAFLTKTQPAERSSPPIPDTRIPRPGVTPPPGLKAASPEILRRSQEARAAHRHRDLSPDQRRWTRENVTLRDYYAAFMEPEQLEKKRRGRLANATLQKERNALARWETYTRPADWPKGRRAPAWPGLTIGSVTDEDVEEFLRRLQVEGGLSPSTARSTWAHLRVIFNHAIERRILRRKLKPRSPRPRRPKAPEIFTDEQLAASFEAFGDRLDLQVAFVLAIAIGARPVDLFLLRWSDFDFEDRRGPVVYFTARKTNKEHGIPISSLTVRHLQRLERSGPYLFPTLTEPAYAEPEKSRTARRRTADTKERLASIGIRFAKPWHACRRTANELLESHRPGAGRFVLGHECTLNSESYRDPDRLVREAVSSLELPGCFSQF